MMHGDAVYSYSSGWMDGNDFMSAGRREREGKWPKTNLLSVLPNIRHTQTHKLST